jgi:hypothetical protein
LHGGIDGRESNVTSDKIILVWYNAELRCVGEG